MSKASLELGGDNWAAKDGNLLGYAQGTSSSKFVPREFTFTRGSNLAATRVAANGLIEKGRENLLLQSNQFDTTWSLANVSATSGQSGYDGSTDAWLITKTTTSSGRIQQSKTSSGVQTFSAYTKKGTLDGVILRVDSTSGNQEVVYNLTNGSVASVTGGVIDSSIESIGNDWYRIQFTFNTSITAVRIYPSTNTGYITTIGNIYIQDAQLEQGMVATSYIESGATTAKAGLLEDEPRIDYTGGTGSLLLEPSRTNLIKHSEYIGSLYSEVGTDVTHNATQSPSGKNSAALIYEESSSSSHWVQTDVTTSSSTTYTQSAFVKKKDSGIYASLRTNGVGGNSYIIFDFDTATIVDTGSDIISSGVVDYSNGWYRIHMTYTLATISFIAGITNSTTNPIPSYLGTGKGYHLWGAQIEQGSYPTSYIPNHSGGSVTRDADDAILTYSNNFNDITIFAEVNSLNVIRDGSAQNIQVGNDTSQGGAFFLRRTSSTTPRNLTAFFKNNDNSDVFSSYELPEGDSKVALKYNSTSNACKLFVDGSEVRSGTATDITEFDTFRLNGDGGKFNSKQLVVFNTELSDAECSALTVEGLKEEILTSYIAAVDTLEDGAEARLDTYLQNLEELIV